MAKSKLTVFQKKPIEAAVQVLVKLVKACSIYSHAHSVQPIFWQQTKQNSDAPI